MSAMQFSTTSGLPDAAVLSLDELLRIVQEGSDAKITLAKLREAFFDNISNSVVLLKKTVTINAGAVHNEDLRAIDGFNASLFEMQHLQVSVSVVAPSGSNIAGYITQSDAVIEHGFKETGELIFRNHYTTALTVNVLVRGFLKGE